MDLRIEFLAGSWLVYQGLMPAAQMLSGLPHPSGANSERIQYFLGRKDASVLSTKTNPGKLDATREQLVTAVPQLN